jgi:hypothetical protein
VKTWEVQVYETVATLRFYTVEAEDEEDALDAAKIGDTVDEADARTGEVTGRFVVPGTLKEVEPD